MRPYANPPLWADFDPMIHSLRWVRLYPFLAAGEAEIWRDDFDPVAKWVKNRTDDTQTEVQK